MFYITAKNYAVFFIVINVISGKWTALYILCILFSVVLKGLYILYFEALQHFFVNFSCSNFYYPNVYTLMLLFNLNKSRDFLAV